MGKHKKPKNQVSDILELLQDHVDELSSLVVAMMDRLEELEALLVTEYNIPCSSDG